MITLKRTYYEDKTTGLLTLPDGSEIKTLERPWLDNQVIVSCIPEAIYKFKRDHYGKHQWFSVLDVPNRTFIEIHPGSKVSHSEGCILMSKKDCIHMLKWFGSNDEFVLEIIS
jgi:hypothetical protein